ncbi:MAG: prepilin peptidase, partial [Peptococcaceae bacterium]|nr:prepilin peptidase [Peptococcaceae bacterium]
MAILFLLFGLIIGSFLNVCIYRLPRRESLAWPGSHCPQCGYVLKWYDNIPVLSYLILRGKCRHCRLHITWRYPLVEGLTGLLWLAAYLHFGLTWYLATRLVFIAMLLVIALIDMEHFIIPNIIVLPGAVLGLGFSLVPGAAGLLSALVAGLGAGLFFLLIWLIYPKGMGEGDIKLALMLGMWLAWPQVGVAIFLASLLGTVGSLVAIKLGWGDRKTPIPFGLYLAVGSIFALFYGPQLLATYLRL